MSRSVGLIVSQETKPSVRELLEQFGCFNLPTLEELGLGIFLYYATGSLNVPDPLPEVYERGSILLNGPRLTHETAKAVLSGYYLKQERYRCIFLALKTTTLCVLETPFFRNYSIPLAIYDDERFVNIFTGFQSLRDNCEFCQIRNALRYNICRYFPELPREVAFAYAPGGFVDFNTCGECLEFHRTRLEQVDEELMPLIVGRPCVRLNIRPEVIKYLFPDEETDQRASGEELWNSFLADYLATLADGFTARANQKIDIQFLREGLKETVDIDCLILDGDTPCLIIETFSGGTLSTYHNFHMLRKFKVFTLAQRAVPGLKCVYVHLGRRKQPAHDYETKVAAFLASEHVYVQLNRQYSQLEQLYQNKKPFGGTELRGLYQGVMEEIRRSLGFYLSKAGIDTKS